jgi:ADP-ribose pyrophosphatase
MSDSASDRTILHEGRFVRLVKQGRWEFAERCNLSGIVGLVAVTDEGRLLLVEQFRPPVGRHVIELPAGLAGDTPGAADEAFADAARRELLEETGYEASSMEFLAAGAASAGLSDEVLSLFRATGLRKVGAAEGDGHEQIISHEVPLAEVEAFLSRQTAAGKLVDLKVYAGLYFARANR